MTHALAPQVHTAMRFLSHYSRRSPTSPMRDGTFKALFNDEKDPEKLIDFLNAVKGYSGNNQIQNIVFRNACFPVLSTGKRNIIADVVCESIGQPQRPPEIHVVEMQWAPTSGVSRWEFYASCAYTAEWASTKGYDSIKRVHITVITPYNLPYPNDSYVLTGKVSRTPIEGTRELTLLSLSRVTPQLSRTDSPLAHWLHFLKYGGTSSLNEEVLSARPVLSRAVEQLRALKACPPPPIEERESKGTTWSLLNRKIRELPP